MVWHPYFTWTTGEAPPAPTGPVTVVGAGGGIYYQDQRRRKHKKRLQENVRDWIDEVYAELTAPEAPKAIRKEAAKVVKPLAESRAKVPAASTVDWSELVEQSQRVEQLLALYEKLDADFKRARIEAQIEDEDAVILGLFL